MEYKEIFDKGYTGDMKADPRIYEITYPSGVDFHDYFIEYIVDYKFFPFMCEKMVSVIDNAITDMTKKELMEIERYLRKTYSDFLGDSTGDKSGIPGEVFASRFIVEKYGLSYFVPKLLHTFHGNGPTGIDFIGANDESLIAAEVKFSKDYNYVFSSLKSDFDNIFYQETTGNNKFSREMCSLYSNEYIDELGLDIQKARTIIPTLSFEDTKKIVDKDVKFIGVGFADTSIIGKNYQAVLAYRDFSDTIRSNKAEFVSYYFPLLDKKVILKKLGESIDLIAHQIEEELLKDVE